MTSKLIWKAEDVVRAVGGKCLQEQTWTASGVSIDSRTTKPGDLFFALIGPTNDGHLFVAKAFEADAVAAIASVQPPQMPAHAPLILVDDTQTALEFLGHAGRSRSSARIVAVTGSVGKTSSKEMLRLMLGANGETYANEGSLNNHWGVPLSLARLPQTAHYGVFEMGMNHAGEMSALSRQVKPHVALITTIEAVHLEFFNSLEDIANAKAEIFYGMDQDGIAILNRDNSQFDRLFALATAQGLKQVLSFGFHTDAHARMIECVATEEGSMIKADILGDKVNFILPVPGEHLALNALGALLTAKMAGGDIEASVSALGGYKPPKGRGVVETIQLKDGQLTLIDESYNASPASVRAAIKVLAKNKGRKILVLGDMRELGTSSPELHSSLAQDIIDAKISTVFTCGEMMAHLNKALPQEIRGYHGADSTALAPHIAKTLSSGDAVTVKGSNSMRMNLIIDAIKALGPNQQKKAS